MEKRTKEEQQAKNTEGREMWLDDNTIKEISKDASSIEQEEETSEDESKPGSDGS